MKVCRERGVFTGNIFLVTGIPTQTPTKDCPPSFLSKVRGNGVLSLQKMFEEGLASVMVAHLNVPSLSPNQIIPLLFLIMLSQTCFKKNWAFRVLFLQML
jgi:hypothetical protein